MAALLQQAMSSGIDVRVWYVALASPELHVARVRARVGKGGHDIPEERIRQRYARSLLNLIRLMPDLAELRVYDNSVEADPHEGERPHLQLILHLDHLHVRSIVDLAATPDWAKPIVIAALHITEG